MIAEAEHTSLTPTTPADAITRTLAIVGAGPKAIALAAKAIVLKKLGFHVPNIVIVEMEGIGANWSGKSGYTDGSSQLRRFVERDIGFPYKSLIWGDEHDHEVNVQMQAYSWHRFLVSKKNYYDWNYDWNYYDWIDRGRPLPDHNLFATYLTWTFEQVMKEVKEDARLNGAVTVLLGEVTRVVANEQKQEWTIHYTAKGSNPSTASPETTFTADGLVITGPGTPDQLSNGLTNEDGYFDAVSFWSHWPQLKYNIESGQSFGVIGSGDAAAAIVVALLEHLHNDVFIHIVTPNGTVYSRGENYWENRYYSNPTVIAGEWLHLSAKHRNEFIKRTDRSVFSQQAQQYLNTAQRVFLIPGRARAIERNGPDNEPNRLAVWTKYGRKRKQKHVFDYVVQSVSLNSLSFLSLLDKDDQDRLPSERRSGKISTKSLENSISPDLSVIDFTPKLHLPMLAGPAQGPGFPTLSCLGLLSDRILGSYTSKPE